VSRLIFEHNILVLNCSLRSCWASCSSPRWIRRSSRAATSGTWTGATTSSPTTRLTAASGSSCGRTRSAPCRRGSQEPEL